MPSQTLVRQSILPSVPRFRKYFTHLGSMVLGYTELEFDFFNLLALSLKRDIGVAVRVMYRVRGEEQRIEVADALIRPAFTNAGLRDIYCEALSDLHHCRKIRNQYAHAQWDIFDKKGLRFVSFEDPAKTPSDTTLHRRRLTVPLVKRQHAYFCYVSFRLIWLGVEFEHATGLELTHPRHPLPPAVARPLPYMRKDKSKHRKKTKSHPRSHSKSGTGNGM
jgi:hypothetical protein